MLISAERGSGQMVLSVKKKGEKKTISEIRQSTATFQTVIYEAFQKKAGLNEAGRAAKLAADSSFAWSQAA